MPFVVGIDQSALHTGVCILDDQGVLVHLSLIEPRQLQNQERLAFIRGAYTKIFAGKRFAAGVMEGYSYSSMNKKFILGEIGAVAKLALYDTSDCVVTAAPKQLKKYVCGKGSASKEDMMLAIEKQWQIVIQDDNLADAYGLAQIARELIWPHSSKRHQLDVVKQLRTKSSKHVVKKQFSRNQFKDAI